jgi:hypothetical protein
LEGHAHDSAEYVLQDGTRLAIPMNDMRRALEDAPRRQNGMVGPFNVNPAQQTVNDVAVHIQIFSKTGTPHASLPFSRSQAAVNEPQRLTTKASPVTNQSTRSELRSTPKNSRREVFKVTGAAVIGAAGALAGSGVTGSMGLSVAGTAIAIGAAPVAIAGALVGLAGYGVYRAIKG